MSSTNGTGEVMDEEFRDCHCPICMELFDGDGRSPENLGCGHTFCRSCTTALKRNAPDVQFQILCPECKSHYGYKAQLTVNYRIKGMAENYAKRLKCSACGRHERKDNMSILCLGCVFSGHRSHEHMTYKEYNLSKELRASTTEKVASTRRDMVNAKKQLLYKLDVVRTVLRNIELNLGADDLPNDVEEQINAINSTKDADRLNTLAEEKKSSLLGKIDKYSSAVENIIEIGRKEYGEDEILEL